MRFPWNKNKKEMKNVQGEFRRMYICRYGSEYEVEITYKGKENNIEFTQTIQEKFKSVEDALDYAYEYIVGRNWLKGGDDEAS